MEQRVDFITLGTPDLEAARRFYVDGLGWEPTLEVPGEVIFIQVGHGRMLSLWDAAAMDADVGARGDARGGRMMLSHNVGSPAEVAAALERASAAGATIVKPAEATSWGGHTGCFADPAGFLWEVAHNPGWRVDADGRVVMGVVDD
jgi:catechol 2,3-dioxygenase-like lactoylglutathione lyase family enzyme